MKDREKETLATLMPWQWSDIIKPGRKTPKGLPRKNGKTRVAYAICEQLCEEMRPACQDIDDQIKRLLLRKIKQIDTKNNELKETNER